MEKLPKCDRAYNQSLNIRQAKPNFTYVQCDQKKIAKCL